MTEPAVQYHVALFESVSHVMHAQLLKAHSALVRLHRMTLLPAQVSADFIKRARFQQAFDNQCECLKLS